MWPWVVQFCTSGLLRLRELDLQLPADLRHPNLWPPFHQLVKKRQDSSRHGTTIDFEIVAVFGPSEVVAVTVAKT